MHVYARCLTEENVVGDDPVGRRGRAGERSAVRIIRTRDIDDGVVNDVQITEGLAVLEIDGVLNRKADGFRVDDDVVDYIRT